MLFPGVIVKGNKAQGNDALSAAECSDGQVTAWSTKVSHLPKNSDSWLPNVVF